MCITAIAIWAIGVGTVITMWLAERELRHVGRVITGVRSLGFPARAPAHEQAFVRALVLVQELPLPALEFEPLPVEVAHELLPLAPAHVPPQRALEHVPQRALDRQRFVLAHHPAQRARAAEGARAVLDIKAAISQILIARGMSRMVRDMFECYGTFDM